MVDVPLLMRGSLKDQPLNVELDLVDVPLCLRGS